MYVAETNAGPYSPVTRLVFKHLSKAGFMKSVLFLITAVLFSHSAFAGDSLLIRGVTCSVFVRKDGKELLNNGDGGKNKLNLPINVNTQIYDRYRNTWDVIAETSMLPFESEKLKELAFGVVVRKDAVGEIGVSVRLNTDSFKKKISGPASKVLTDSYTITVGGTAGPEGFNMHSGSFSSEWSTNLDCKPVYEEVNFANY